MREAEAQGFRGWNERGYLPHRDSPGLSQFVTFRLADTYPEALRREWEHLWLLDNPRRRLELEGYLDRGRGRCYLRDCEVSEVVENALLRFHGDRYDLRAWCIMPNHVHVLFKVKAVPMAEIVGSWKKYTAYRINRRLHRCGRFWAEDYWDTYMRDSEQERRAVRYIENNPTKARLVLDPKSWLRSSAKWRSGFRSPPEAIPDAGTPDAPGEARGVECP